jgi:mono/diheme cytochrome c family protein
MGLILRLLGFLLAMAIGLIVAAAVILFLVLPRMQWSATARPSAAEGWVARYVLGNWVRSGASREHDPIPSTPQNLRDGEREYDEHCAVCHGFDGSAKNRVGGDFYPPIARLARGAPDLSDGQIFFIVSNGIRMTAMPGFGPQHSPDELWKIILWVRHLPNLTPQERAAIAAHANENESPGLQRQK